MTPTASHHLYLSGQILDWRVKSARRTVHGARFRLLPWLSRSRVRHFGYIRRDSSAPTPVRLLCSYFPPCMVMHRHTPILSETRRRISNHEGGGIRARSAATPRNL